MMTDRSLAPPWSFLERAVASAPAVGFVVVIVVAGLVGSAVVRRLVSALVRRSGMEAFAERAGISRVLYAVGLKRGLAAVLGGLGYVAGLVLTFSAASDAAGLTVVSTLTTNLLKYLPRLLTALGLLLGTFVVATVARSFVEGVAARRNDVNSPKTAATIAYALVLTIGAILSAEQAGIEVAFLTTLLQVAVGVVGLGLALSFALGFHSVFRNMAARHYYRPLLRVGDTVRIGDDEGTVVRFAPTALVLRTADGERIVPCARFLLNTVHVRDAAKPPGSQ
jgi:hypothetical protein